jgi:hypothetical protein
VAVLRALAFAVLLALVGCSRSNVKPGTAPVYYSDNRSVALLPTSAMTEKLDMPQHLRGEFTQQDGSLKSFEGDSWVRANDTILSIMLFSGFGTTIAEITYGKDSVHFESSVMDVEKMKAEYVLADFQVCFYPYKALKDNFEEAGFVFEESRGGANLDYVRTLKDGNTLVLTAERKGKEITLVNSLRHYSYHITLGEEQ